ncbi:ricin-type beta-trefoil lectin domain protein [gamma proteobacterium HTCC5015]|nr:ricin-type beta-trefoil lectin domain protein [gamma proteobacterium HTCC5015]
MKAMVHRLQVLLLLALFSVSLMAQAVTSKPYEPATDDEKKAQTKLMQILALAKTPGSSPQVLYKPNLVGGSTGIDFTVPGTDLTATTFYSRSSGQEVWHAALVVDTKTANQVQPLTKAYKQLADILGQPEFESLVLVTSEGDGKVKPNVLSKYLQSAVKGYEEKKGIDKGKLVLKKGINVFAKIKTPKDGPLKTWERIVLAGGEVTAGTLDLSGHLGYDLIDKLFSEKEVKTEEQKILEKEQGLKKDPLPYSLSIAFPEVTPAPFAMMNERDAKKILYSQLLSTKLSIDVDKANGSTKLSGAQTNKIWLAGKDFEIDGKLTIEEKEVAGKKEVTLTGSGGVSVSGIGTRDFSITGLDLKGTTTFEVSRSGDVEQTEAEAAAAKADGVGKEKAARKLGFGLGATVSIGGEELRGAVMLNTTTQGRKVDINDVSIGLAGELKLGKIAGLKSSDPLYQASLSDLYFGIAPPESGASRPDLYVTAGINFSNTVGGKVSIVTEGNQAYVLMTANQMSVADVVDSFAGDNLLKKNTQERKVMNSIVMPQVIVALGMSTRPSSKEQGVEVGDLPTPVQNQMLKIVSSTSASIPISQDGVSVVGKVNFDNVDTTFKDAQKALGIELSKEALVAVSLEGMSKGNLVLGVAAQLPTFSFPEGKNDVGNVVSMKEGTASFFLRLNTLQKAFELGVSGNMVLKLPKSGGGHDEVLLVGDTYVSLQATGAGVRVSGYMMGDWQAPLGFDGMTFKNGAILVGVDTEGAVEFGAGVKVAFDITSNPDLARVMPLRGDQAMAYQADQLQSLQSYQAGNVDNSNDIATGFVINMVLSTGIPTPKKVGFSYEADRLSLQDVMEINDILVAGVVTGDLANGIINPLPNGPVKDALRGIQQGAKDRSASKAFIQAAEASPIPINDLQFRNVELFFATPGAVLPGFPGLNGKMGVAIAGDVYVRNAKGTWDMVRVPNTTKKFEIRLTTEGLSLGGLGELIENTYYDARSVTIDAMAAEWNCPKGSFFDVGHSSCWSCPSGYSRTAAPVTAGNACIKRTVQQQKATYLQDANLPWGCPSGSFYDPRNEGECWSCPNGFGRNANPVDHPKACTQLKLANFKRANHHGKGYGIFGTDCGSGQFWDPNGNCYSCPKNYIRGVAPVTSGEACVAVDISLKESKASLVRKGKPNDPNAFFDVGLGQFWKCPTGYNRTVFSVKSSQACEKVTVNHASGTAVPRGQIHDKASKLCMGVVGGDDNIKRLGKIESQACLQGVKSRSQSWFLDSAGRLRPLQQVNFVDEGKNIPLCAQPAGAKTGEQTQMLLEQCNHNAEQKWYVDEQQRIRNKKDHSCLESRANGSPKLVECRDKQTTQQWTFGPKLEERYQAKDESILGTVALRSRLHSLCATDNGSAKQTTLQTCLGSRNQRWNLLQSGKIKSDANNCLVFSGEPHRVGEGTAVKTYRCDDKDARIFWTQDEKGRIRSRVNSNLCVVVQGANKKEGTVMELQDCKDHAAHYWDGVSAPASGNGIDPVKQPKPFYTSARKYKKGTGLIGTDCPKGQVWNAKNGMCYGCPNNTKPSFLGDLDSTKACIGYGDKPRSWVFPWGDAPPEIKEHPWNRIPGHAKDISISSTGVVWIVGVPGDMFYRNVQSNSWVKVDGHATHIAAGVGDKAYHLASNGAIYQGNMNGWSKMPGSASDIAAGPDGEIWHLSKSTTRGQDHAMYRWNGSGWSGVQGAATKVALGDGIAYHMNDAGAMYRSTNKGRSWTSIPGIASDIAVAKDGTVFHLSKGDVGDKGKGIYFSKDKGQTWTRITGQATRVAMTPDGYPWVLNRQNLIYDGDKHYRVQPKEHWSCPNGYNKNITRHWSASNACEKQVFAKATRHRKLDASCPSGQEKQMVGDKAGYCISCPSGYKRDIAVIEPTNSKACFKTSNRNTKATYHGKGYGIFGTDCGSGQFLWIPSGNCFSCPRGTISDPTISPDDPNHCKGSSTSRRAATIHSKPQTSCPSGQFQHLLPVPGDWFGHCVSCPSGYVRNANPVNAGNACDKMDTKRAIKIYK